MKFSCSSLLLILVLGIACSPTRFVKPLEKGEHAINASVGGPIVNVFDANIPLPISSICYANGIKSNLTWFGAIHTTALGFGIYQLELGVTKGWLQTDTLNWRIPGLSTSLAIHNLWEQWNGTYRFWPQLDINAYWESTNKKNLFYLGINNWFELAQKRAHDEIQNTHWILSPQLGYQRNQNKWGFTFETKYLAPMHANKNLALKYYNPISSQGAIGLYIGISRKF